MIRVLLIDDDPLVVQSLEMIIQTHPSIQVVAKGHSGKEAIELYSTWHPDILLLDIRMEKMDGLQTAQSILRDNPKAKILFLTTFRDDETLTIALTSGCKGYLLKQNIQGLLPAIEAVANGNLVFDSEIVHSLHSLTSKQFPELTERELALLELVAEGLNNKEIASKLYLSEGTVRNYLSLLLEKLGLRDRTQLAIYYYKHR